jgi:hypothetical protein
LDDQRNEIDDDQHGPDAVPSNDLISKADRSANRQPSLGEQPNQVHEERGKKDNNPDIQVHGNSEITQSPSRQSTPVMVNSG